MALAAGDEQEKEQARGQLTGMLQQLEAYNLLDQLEILCSRQLISRSPLLQEDSLQLIQ